MKGFKILCLFFAVCLVSCSEYDTKQPAEDKGRGKLFIIGGGSRPDSLMDRMISEAGLYNGGYMVILPMSSELPDSAIIWTSEQLYRMGVENIAGYNFLHDEEPKMEWVDSIRHASLIYITGGDQNRFMDIVHKTEIESAIIEAWKNGAMIAGTSAGAAVMSKKMITGDEKFYPEYRTTPRTIEAENVLISNGLGFLDNVIIDQHFVWRSRYNRLLSLIIEYPDHTGIGIDESTAILVNGSDAEVVGASQVVVFSNSEKSYHEEGGKLGAKNIVLDIYLPGEIFSIK